MIKRIIKRIRRLIYRMTVCQLKGHSFDGDWGYGGGDYADVWCRHCDKFGQVHKTSIWFKKRDAKILMAMVGTKDKE